MMEFITRVLANTEVYAITMTLIHSLWQAALIAAVIKLTLSFIERSTTRYLIGIVASLMVLVLSICTYSLYVNSMGVADHSVAQKITSISSFGTTNLDIESPTTSFLISWSPIIFVVWIVGVLLHLLNIIRSVGSLYHTRKGEVSIKLGMILHDLKSRLHISEKVSVLESAKASVPHTFGFLKPVILFPIGLVNMLTIEEVEAIMVHELAHIERRDYLVNIIQNVLEAFYFFNPAVRWMQKVARAERESICDEAAIAAGISPMTYAKTLVKLEEAKQFDSPSLAMAITSDKHQLLNRIKRIFNKTQTSRTMKVRSLATVLMMALAIVFSTSVLTGNSPSIRDKASSLIPVIMKIDDIRSQGQIMNQKLAQIDTLPQSRSTVSIHTNTNGKEMSLTKENGKITSLKIDGKVIPESEYDKYSELTDDVIIMESPQGNNMMFFGGREGFESLDFDQMFDSEQMKKMMEGFKGFEGFDFAFPDMERFEMLKEPFLEFDAEQMESFKKQMEEMGGQLKHMRIDTIFEFDKDNNSELGERFQFFLDENEEGELNWNSDSFGSNNSATTADVLGAELNRDGLLEPFKDNRVELTGKYLKINGDKQPKNIWGKYKRIYEEQAGILMTKKTRIDFTVEGKKSNRKIRAF